MNTADTLAAWCARAHERCHEREAGTYGPDDQGCRAGCTDTCEWRREPARALPLARERAARNHAKYEHLGTPGACQSPHDVLCKAVWR